MSDGDIPQDGILHETRTSPFLQVYTPKIDCTFSFALSGFCKAPRGRRDHYILNTRIQDTPERLDQSKVR